MYFILNKNTREVVRRSETPFNIDDTIQPPSPMIQLKRVDVETKPTFDAATQKLVHNFTDNDAAFTRTFAYSVVALDTAERSTVTQQTQDETARLQIKAVIADVRNGVGTAVERLVRLEKAVAYLLRYEVRR